MPRPDQVPHTADDPESVYRVYFATDVRPAIRAAAPEQMRGVLRAISADLCRYLHRDADGIPAPGPGQRQAGQARQAGSGLRAGFQLYHNATQAVSGSFLHAIGFDPGRAAADDAYLTTCIDPVWAGASAQHMRQTLLNLADHLQAVLDDSDTCARASAQAAIPDDLWEIATGVTAAIQLYRHAARARAAHVLYYLWDGLGTGSTPPLAPFTPDTADPTVFAVSPN